jgi:hypothetical protein
MAPGRGGRFAEAQDASSGGVIFDNFTAGLGLHFGGVTLDYAMQRNGDLSGDVTNYLSFTYAYEEPAEERPAAVPQEEVSEEKPEELPAGGTAQVPVRGIRIKHFPDVPKDFWGKQEIELLATAGIMWGYADGAFHPQNGVTRSELATILSVGKHVPQVRVSNETRPVTRAEAAARLGIKTKLDRPRRPITRAELAKLIYQTDWAQAALKRLPVLTE